MRESEVRCEVFQKRDSQLVLVAYGSMARLAKACMEKARQEGLKVGLLRPVTLWPFPCQALDELARDKRRFLVVEMSAGQMVEDVRLGTGGKAEVSFFGRTGGGIPTEDEVLAEIRRLVEAGAKG
jgi:2-oxoglutarate ferredoxin oxidoreductase subunit alpha